MRPYTIEDLRKLANDTTVEMSYGIPVIIKNSPEPHGKGHLDPWVRALIDPSVLTHGDGALQTSQAEKFDQMRAIMTDDQIVRLLQKLSGADRIKLPFRGEFNESEFTKPIDISYIEECVDGIMIRFWKCQIPDGSKNRPAFIHVHGGGWFAGCAVGCNSMLRHICEKSNAVCFDVEYSLTPDARFPTQNQQCYQALKYIYEHADEYGIDKAKIAMGGGSGGGHLTASVALMEKEAGSNMLALQILMNPATLLVDTPVDGYDFDAAVFHIAPETLPVFGKPVDFAKDPNALVMVHAYLGSEENGMDYRASPMLARDFSGLPRALVFTAEFDQLRPQGEFYASQLSKAGVPVTVYRYMGCMHDSIGKHGLIPQVEDVYCIIADALKRL